jgi:hypothetical protein
MLLSSGAENRSLTALVCLLPGFFAICAVRYAKGVCCRIGLRRSDFLVTCTAHVCTAARYVYVFVEQQTESVRIATGHLRPWYITRLYS